MNPMKPQTKNQIAQSRQGSHCPHLYSLRWQDSHGPPWLLQMPTLIQRSGLGLVLKVRVIVEGFSSVCQQGDICFIHMQGAVWAAHCDVKGAAFGAAAGRAAAVLRAYVVFKFYCF